MQTQSDSGIVSRLSAHSVDETVAKLQTLLEQRNIRLFALVDHSGEAAMIGMNMPPTKLLIFGNPKAGTPVMLAAPTSAIDLPLKLRCGKTPTARPGFPITIPNIFRIGITCRPTWSRTWESSLF